jgi:hypothetical protein
MAAPELQEVAVVGQVIIGMPTMAVQVELEVLQLLEQKLSQV